MITFIDDNKARWGVEPICTQLPIAPSTYYDFKKRSASARATRDEELKPKIMRVFRENYEVYGADKIWAQMNREQVKVARCTVERLMRDLGIKGATRGKSVRTTVPDESARQLPDLVKRRFYAPAPNRLWVSDLERHEALTNRAVMKGHRL
jgi:putative transposase